MADAEKRVLVTIPERLVIGFELSAAMFEDLNDLSQLELAVVLTHTLLRRIESHANCSDRTVVEVAVELVTECWSSIETTRATQRQVPS